MPDFLIIRFLLILIPFSLVGYSMVRAVYYLYEWKLQLVAKKSPAEIKEVKAKYHYYIFMSLGQLFIFFVVVLWFAY